MSTLRSSREPALQDVVSKKLYYKIGEACRALDIQPYVLRYWETEFPFLNPNKSRSGQRVYTSEELSVIRRIKELLYEEGYTIAGAKKKLEAEIEKGEAGKTVGEPPESSSPKPVAEEDVATDEAPKAKPASSSKGKSSAPSPAAGAEPDGDRVQHLEQGLRNVLEQARSILQLLGEQ